MHPSRLDSFYNNVTTLKTRLISTKRRIHGWPLTGNIVIGGIGTILFVLLVIFGPEILNLDPYTQDLHNITSEPSIGNSGVLGLFGTDSIGRDVFSRVVVGGRNSLLISLIAVLLTTVIGVTLGLVSGYFEGIIGEVIMRLTDIQLALPFILLTIAILTVIQPTITNIIIALALTRWVGYARTGRALVLSIKYSDYVLAARALGASKSRILIRYILPSIISPLVAIAGIQLAFMITMESTLSYIGLGVQPPEPSWGNMMRLGQAYLNSAWWIAFFPALFLIIFVLSINLFAEGLRRALVVRQRL